MGDDEEQRDAASPAGEAPIFALLDALPLPIAYCDRRERLVFQNGRYTAWGKLPTAPGRGQSLRQVAGERAYVAIAGHVARALAGEPAVFAGCLTYANTAECRLRVTFLPHRLASGIVGVFVCFEELTGGGALAAANSDSETARLLRARTLSDMTLGLAHELSQPLAAALAYLQGSLRHARAGSPVSSELMLCLEQAAEQTRRAGEIVQQIRRFARRDKAARRRLDLRQLVARAVQDVAAAAAAAGITLSLAETTAVPLIIAEPFALEQVILGLLRNAIEALAEAPAPASRRIRLAIRGVDDSIVAITVSDNGPGVAAQLADRLFEPFVTTKPGGVGLGLAICRAIVREHGGELWLDRSDQSATTFVFTLPTSAPGDPEEGNISQD